MRALILFVFSVLIVNINHGQVEFYDGTEEVLGDEVLRSTICIGFNDLNGDLRDDLFLLDRGKVLKTFTQGAPNNVFDYKEHFQVSIFGEWSFISGDLDNDGVPEIISSGNEFGSQFLWLLGDKYAKLYDTPDLFSQNSNLVDLNNDGFLDFFVCNDDGENGMFLNDGNGVMSKVQIIDFQTSPEDDLSGNYSSIFTDIDGDNDLDLYIGKCRANVTDPTDPRRVNTLYINNGDGTYSERGEEFGLAIGAQSWSVDSGDIDNDGDIDMIVANHDRPHDLMINNGEGFFERKQLIPDGYSSFAFQSFFCDFDNNGWLDIIFTNPTASFVLYNDEMSFTRRELFTTNQKPFSVATGDLNTDGFPDLYFGFANSFQQPSLIEDVVLMNETNFNNYLDIKLIGSVSNRDAVGSKITLYSGANIQTREVVVGKSYGIMNSTTVHFGLGQTSQVDSIVVRWPSGIQTSIKDPQEINTLYTHTEDGCTTNTYTLPNLQLCGGEGIEVTLPDGYDNYNWSNGSNDMTLMINEVGWYSATFEKDGCITRTSYFEVTEELTLDQQDILPHFDQVICNGDNIKLTASSGTSYEWSSGENSQTIDVVEAGIYNVTMTTNCSTYVSDPVEIQIADVIIPNVANDTVKIGESALLVGESEALNWYQNKNDLTPLATGMEFVTPPLVETETYYVGEANSGFGFNQSLMSTVPLNNVGDSIYTTNDFISFVVFEELTINSVKVRTQKPGVRKFLIYDKWGLIAFYDIDLSIGVSTIDLDFQFSPGLYIIGTDADINQSNLGSTHPQFSYSEVYIDKDKQINGYLEIMDSQLVPGLSPYFFDWDIDFGFYDCEPRIPVHAVVKMPVFTSELNNNSIVYPNPTSGLVHIVSDMTLPYTVAVYDVSGKMLEQIKSNHSEISIELPKVSGMYFLKMTNATEQVVKKVYAY